MRPSQRDAQILPVFPRQHFESLLVIYQEIVDKLQTTFLDFDLEFSPARVQISSVYDIKF